MPGISRNRQYDELDREFHEFMKKYDRRYKSEMIRVNISSSFIARARCPECGSAPNYYFQMRKPYQWRDVRQMLVTSRWLRQLVGRMTEDWYLDDEPRYFLNIREFSFKVEDKRYLPKMHHSRGFPGGRDNVVEFVGCDCGTTVWAFNQKSVKNRPEITNRKGRYNYPNKFEY